MIRTMQLEDVDVGNRRITVGGHVRPLDDLARHAALDWLDHRTSRWPNTASFSFRELALISAQHHARNLSNCAPRYMSQLMLPVSGRGGLTGGCSACLQRRRSVRPLRLRARWQHSAAGRTQPIRPTYPPSRDLAAAHPNSVDGRGSSKAITQGTVMMIFPRAWPAALTSWAAAVSFSGNAACRGTVRRP